MLLDEIYQTILIMFLILLNSQCNDASVSSPGCVQFLQYYYQRGCLYRLRALGERNHLDLTVGEVVHDALFAKWGSVRQKGQVWEPVIPRWLCGLQRCQICTAVTPLPCCLWYKGRNGGESFIILLGSWGVEMEFSDLHQLLRALRWLCCSSLSSSSSHHHPFRFWF